jgi:hypothetical protein
VEDWVNDVEFPMNDLLMEFSLESNGLQGEGLREDVEKGAVGRSKGH